MSEDNLIPFLDMFPFCTDFRDMCGGLDKAIVKSATVNKEKLHMTVTAVFQRSAIAPELHTMEGRIAAEYGLNSVTISSQGVTNAAAAPSKSAASPSKSGEKKGQKRGNAWESDFWKDNKGRASAYGHPQYGIWKCCCSRRGLFRREQGNC